jgi:hypothetical protein
MARVGDRDGGAKRTLNGVPSPLSVYEKAALVAFLRTLTDQRYENSTLESQAAGGGDIKTPEHPSRWLRSPTNLPPFK